MRSWDLVPAYARVRDVIGLVGPFYFPHLEISFPPEHAVWLKNQRFCFASIVSMVLFFVIMMHDLVS